MRFGTTGDEVIVATPKDNKNKGWTPEYAATQPVYLSFDNDEGLPMTKDQWVIMDDVEALLKIKKFKRLSDNQARRMLKMLRLGGEPTAQEFGLTQFYD